MILSEKGITKLISRKYFPFQLAGSLYLSVVLIILLFAAFGTNADTLWMIGGTELLIYLIGNAVCSLVVQKIGRFVKFTFIAYVGHLILLIMFIRLFSGNTYNGYEIVIPIYGALAFCFITSMGIILLIRQVLTMLKDN